MNAPKDSPAADGELQVLALNSGSSSLKFGLYRVGSSGAECAISGAAESIGDARCAFQAKDAQGRILLRETHLLSTHEEAIVRVGKLLDDLKTPAPQAIGHRIVHGGPALREHCRIDDEVQRKLEAATAFAPLHAPAALSVIRFAQARFPGLPQVACFDTEFHARMPDVAHTLALPASLRSQGIQRYGFHGLSCESILHQLAGHVPSRLVIAHLGNGASLTAVKDGVSIDTTMGLTPTGGVIMSTRSGDLDPGVLVYLAREKKFDASMLADLVDRRSGLLGVSGIGGDMRTLREAAGSNADARLAIRMFCYAVRKQLGAMSAALEGLDLIVFTGGIGENDAQIRADICGGLDWLGVSLDEGRNREAATSIGSDGSRVEVRILPSREDEQIARRVRALI